MSEMSGTDTGPVPDGSGDEAREPERSGTSGAGSSPVVPQPASTVAVVRDGDSGPETLLVQRPNSGFAPGAWVFPGGTVDLHDYRLPGEISEIQWSWARRLEIEDPAEAWGYLVAAVREAWEETGILIGSARVPSEEVRSVRRRLIADDLDFFTAARTIGFEPAFGTVVYLARWVTPPSLPRRYDTRFFLASAPPGSIVTLEGGELLDAAWIDPADAIHRWETQKLSMLLPTVHTLRTITGFESTREMLATLRHRPPPTFQPTMDPGIDSAQRRGALPGRP